MSSSNTSFVKSLLTGPKAEKVVQFLDLANHCPDTWRVLERPLRKEIQVFQYRQIASAYARVLGADDSKIARRQEFLLRTAVTSILFPLEAMEDRLLILLDERGLPALFHHSIRELCDHTSDTADIFAAADACRVAVFRIEDAMRDPLTGNCLEEPEKLLEITVDALAHLQHVLADTEIPFGWPGVALLWVTANFGLGTLPDDPTATEHFAEL